MRHRNDGIRDDVLLGHIEQSPRTAMWLAQHYEPRRAVDAGAVRAHLNRLQEDEAWVTRPASKGGQWSLGAGAGLVLAATAGSAMVNAAVCDGHGRPLKQTLRSRRRLRSDDSPKLIIGQLAGVIAAAYKALAPSDAGRVLAIGVAVPFGLRPDRSVASDLRSRARIDVDARLRDRVSDLLPGLWLVQDRSRWRYLPDVTAEAVAEHAFGHPAVAGSPSLVVIKATREIRAAFVQQGIAYEGAHGDTADFGHSRADLAELDDDEVALVTGPRGSQLCAVCRQPACLQQLVSAAALYAVTHGPDDPDFNEASEAAEEASDRVAFDRLFARALATGQGRESFRLAGHVLGRTLDPVIRVLDPQAVVLTGFIARAQPFIDGVTEACSVHPETHVTASAGIEFERGNLLAQASPAAVTLDPRTVEHQYRPTVGIARHVHREVVLPDVLDAVRERQSSRHLPPIA